MSNQERQTKPDGGASVSTDGLGVCPTMAEAIAAGDGVLLNEQAALLRQCRAALDGLLGKHPMLGAMQYTCGGGSDTLGNLRASMYAYRPQGVFGTSAHNV